MSQPPNILVIMTDQQRYEALSAHGGAAHTPNIDRLVASGIDLQRHYSQCPVCVPSRSVMFTGLYPQGTGVYENNVRVAPECLEPFSLLKNAGYRLGYFGKDHFFPTAERDLIDDYDECHAASDHPDASAMAALISESRRRLDEDGCHASGMFHDFPDDVTEAGLVGRAAASFIRRSPTDTPFCMVASFRDPHVPHIAPRRFAEAHAPNLMPAPTSGPESLVGKHPRYRIKREAQQAHLATSADTAKYRSVYHAMIAHVDEQIGCVLDALQTRPDGDNTLIVFTSDHGDFCGNHGMFKKDLVLNDDLLHVPFIVRLPHGHGAGRSVVALTEHVDLTPTLLDFAGLSIPDHLQGTSLRPLLTGLTDRHKSATFSAVCPPGERNPYPDFGQFRAAWLAAQRTASPHPLKFTRPYNVPGDHCQSIRTEQWRYVFYQDGFEELYDLTRDPNETHNIADLPRIQGMRFELRERLAQHHKQHRSVAFSG